MRSFRNITSPEYGAVIPSMIGQYAHEEEDYYMQKPIHAVPVDHGTTHVSVLDEVGNAVSITATINWV